jgi:hypothetical protein
VEAVLTHPFGYVLLTIYAGRKAIQLLREALTLRNEWVRRERVRGN